MTCLTLLIILFLLSSHTLLLIPFLPSSHTLLIIFNHRLILSFLHHTVFSSYLSFLHCTLFSSSRGLSGGPVLQLRVLAPHLGGPGCGTPRRKGQVGTKYFYIELSNTNCLNKIIKKKQCIVYNDIWRFTFRTKYTEIEKMLFEELKKKVLMGIL